MALLALTSPALVVGSEIVDTTTTTGEVIYLVNCTAPCTAKLLDLDNTLIGEANHTGLEYGSFSVAAGLYNLTLWEGSVLVDAMIVNTGVFNTTFPEEIEERLGKRVVGIAIIFGTGLSAILLGLEGGLMVLGIALMIAADQGYAPGWLLYVVYMAAAFLFGIGLAYLIGRAI
jgi:hypothetical protein